MTIPHKFPSLIDGSVDPILFVGSGVSIGITPGIPDLIKLTTQVELDLGFSAGIDLDDDNNDYRFYEWAEEIIRELERRGEACPKLKFAQLLGLTSRSDMLGETVIPLSNISPRHRVIARLIKEKRINSLWTFNWDTLIEKALERVGLERKNSRTSKMPWPTEYSTFITEDDYDSIQDSSIIPVFKPHGCIQSMIDAERFIDSDTDRAKKLSSRFMVKKSELDSWIQNANDTDQSFGAHLITKLPRRPIIIAGWSISERYFHEFLSKYSSIIQPLTRKDTCDDPLTIIGPSFGEGHRKMATYFGVNQGDTHFIVSEKEGNGYTTDHLFLWIQAQYALTKIISWLDDQAACQQNIIAALDTNISSPNSSSWIIKWVDKFLPDWTRLCWREGLIEFYLAGRLLDPHQLSLIAEDIHIPLNLGGADRIDLKSAGIFLSYLLESGREWNYDKFPGCLWCSDELRLIIPIPTWRVSRNRNSLAGLKTKIKDIAQGKGFVNKLDLLPLEVDKGIPDRQIRKEFREKIAKYCESLAFVNENSINIIELQNLQGA